MGGKVSCNFGPKFKVPLRKGKPLCQANSLVFAPEIAQLVEQDTSAEITNVKTEMDEKVSETQAVQSNENVIVKRELL